MRKEKLAEGCVYHIFSKSIAGYVIFNDKAEYDRMLEGIRFYQMGKPLLSFARFCECSKEKQLIISKASEGEDQVEVIAYCLMPTHVHFILKQKKEDGISGFMNNLLNSYTKYFNKKHGRKGPLWESRFKNVLVEDDIQLKHLTRYIHLNPVTARIIDDPRDWQHSSYQEYTGNHQGKSFCEFKDLIDINPNVYSEFVKDRIGYQRELASIKALLLE
jgi:putative transposase